ncbi:MAG: glutathione S-transferase family protein [Myxococcota bacterium]
MGLLIDGQWRDQWYDTEKTDGKFVRPETSFRDAVRADGSTAFTPDSGRYHLYVSLACPWAHRVLIVRALAGLEPHIDVSVVHPDMLGEGWTFETDFQGATGDRLLGKRRMFEVYQAARADFTGRVTVPVLWDRETGTIVNNESSELIRFLSEEFRGLTGSDHPPLYPEAHRDEIDAVNERVYHTVNNGVYKCGFATKQAAYEESFVALFDTLEWLEARLATQRYLVGDRLTEADIRLFTTMIRFDAVYHGHFKCNRKRLVDYPNLWGHTRELYQMPAIRPTVDLPHIRRHYHYSHESINPHRIVPMGPDVDSDAPHGRD